MESHFWYSKSQRNGILFLFLMLFFVQFALHFVDFSDYEYLEDQNFTAIQAKIDSLKKTEKNSSRPGIYPFNPNFLTDFKAYKLGMSVEEIDRLLTYRRKGEFVNSPQEFQRVTKIHDSLLRQLSPHFKFPEWLNPKASNKKIFNIEKHSVKIRDINQATAEEIMSVKVVDLKMAKRIIAYRTFLQGFSSNEQLYEVYYLKKEVAELLLQFFQVIELPSIKKININKASFKELLQLPYLDYKLTKKIFQYRDENLLFENLQELKKIDSFPMEKFDRIALYLCAQ